MSTNEPSNPRKKQKTQDTETQPPIGNDEITTLMKKANAIRSVNIEIYERMFPPSIVIDKMKIEAGILYIWWILAPSCDIKMEGRSVHYKNISICDDGDKNNQLCGEINLVDVVGSFGRPEMLRQLISSLENDQVALGKVERKNIECNQEVDKLSELLGIKLHEEYPTSLDLQDKYLNININFPKLILPAVEHYVDAKNVVVKKNDKKKKILYEAIFSQTPNDNFTKKDMILIFGWASLVDGSIRARYGGKLYTITKDKEENWNPIWIEALNKNTVND